MKKEKAENKRVQLIKRLVNKGFDYQMMGVRALKDFLRDCRDEDFERDQ